MPDLYPAQSAIVSKLVALPKPRRAILPWDTGCGKTVAACELIKRTGAQSVLIVCPAIVREHWARHVREWGAPGSEVGVLGESALAANRAGYAAYLRHCEQARRAIVVTSYGLLFDAPDHEWDLIILDELHHIADPATKQSKLVKKLIQRYPNADIIGLSATLAPTEIKQVWNPLRLFEGEAKWGHPTKRGGISWTFLNRYCESEKTEWGTNYYGLKPHMAEQLRVKMSDVAHPLTRAEVLPDMPPLQLEVVSSDDHWALIDERTRACKKILILTHKRKLAHEISFRMGEFERPSTCITGAHVPKVRAVILDDASRREAVAICATYDSLLEGIRVLWPDQVLILDWSGSPGRLMQLLGRFVSVGSEQRPLVTLVCNDATYSASQAIAHRAPGMIATGLSTTGLDDVAAKIEEQVSGAIDWDNIFASATGGDWSDD